MILEIPVFTAIRYMVCEGKSPLRGFHTKEEAKRFIADDDDLTIVTVPKRITQIEVEEAPY